RGLYVLNRGSFDSFSATTLAVDPGGMFIAAGDDGGSSETAMGMTTAQGESQVTLIRAGEQSAFAAIEKGNHAVALEFDPWRGRLLVNGGNDIGAWSPSGEQIARFAPYGVFVRAMAVSRRWIATTPDVGVRPRIDFFDPETYAPLAAIELERPVSP